MANSGTTFPSADLRDRVAAVGRSWWWFAAFGAISVIAGVMALAWPGRTLLVLAVLFGAQLVVSGIFRLVAALTMDDGSGGARTLSAILGIFGLLVGLYALRHIVITVLALGLVLGIYWVIDGVAQLFTAIEHKAMAGRTWAVVSGVFGTIAGIVLLSWPGLSLLTLAVITGIWLIMFGFIQFTIAGQIRRLAH
jgi:uncharacterized membrane protein HdeD (DUF308 family)